MKIINENIFRNIMSNMDLLDEDNLNMSRNYIVKCFSAFNHWLGEEEALDKITFYEDAIAKRHLSSYKEYYDHHNRFLNFYISLYNKTTVYGVLFDERGTNKIVKFDNIKEYKSHVLLSIREQLFLKIVIPEYFSVITGGHDLTHLLYTLKSRPKSFESISLIIQSNDLSILN